MWAHLWNWLVAITDSTKDSVPAANRTPSHRPGVAGPNSATP